MQAVGDPHAPTLSALLERQRAYFQATLKTASVRSRIQRLKAMRAWVFAHEAEIRAAVQADFHKPAHEADLTEILPVVGELNDAIANLHDWTRPRRVSTPISMIGTRSEVHHEPKGCSLILAPFNFPFMLTVSPLISAVAAGCTAVVKPSEFTPHTTQLIADMIQALFAEDEVACVQGDHTTAQALTALPFDHIFFTGSPEVGKKVMHAAAEHLASVTLELGGRNPVIVDETADLKDAARKLVWGEFMNAGQSCMSPNYIMVHDKVHDKFLGAVMDFMKTGFGDLGDLSQHPNYAHVITQRHQQRLSQLVKDTVAAGATLVTGGQTSPNSNFLAPTILKDVKPEHPVMQQEIFGPIMPILRYHSLDEALRLIQSIERPLGLYIFSRSERHIQRIIRETASGSLMVNETTIAFGHPGLPFGGAGFSGIGKAHGHAGFMAFTNEKPVVRQSRYVPSTLLAFPPYSGWKSKVLRLVIRWF
jgi:aldehyde dehydrogenase (NAD+)